MPTFPDGIASEQEAAALAIVNTEAAAKPKRIRKPAAKKSAKPKAKKSTKKKASKPKAKKSPAKSKRVRKPIKKSKGKKTASSGVRTERLDLRLSKAEKAKIVAKAKKTRRTVTSLVTEAIEKIR